MKKLLAVLSITGCFFLLLQSAHAQNNNTPRDGV
jgi:hypothetical protein